MTTNVLISGSEMDSTIVNDLAAHDISATIVDPSQLQYADLSKYSGVWLGWSTNFDNSSGNLGSNIASFTAHGGNVLVETPYTNALSFLPGGVTGLQTNLYNGNGVHIVNSSTGLTAGLADADLSNWNESFHETFSNLGPFTGITNTPETDVAGQWVTIEKSIGRGNLVLTGQDASFHSQYGAGDAAGAFGSGIQLAVDALTSHISA